MVKTGAADPIIYPSLGWASFDVLNWRGGRIARLTNFRIGAKGMIAATIKQILRPVIPEFVSDFRRRRRNAQVAADLGNAGSVKEKFSRIYERSYWGTSTSARYYSGPGSHDPSIAQPYVHAVSDFIRSLPKPPVAVDLGCGDFAIGSKIAPLCEHYLACDVVDDVIAYNAGRFSASNLEFRVLNIIDQELPDADVAFIRQVLQHLSNNDVAKVAAKLSSKYKYVIVTEDLPVAAHWTPNIDKPSDHDVRTSLLPAGSGIVLTQPPFNLKPREVRHLCSAETMSTGRPGIIKTDLLVF